MIKKLIPLLLLPLSLFANIADPWWDTAWRFRSEVNLVNAEANQMAKVNIDFAALNLPGTLDPDSIRIVKQDGVTVLTVQEYNDNIYNDLNDAVGNSTGEVKFIVEDTAPAVRYYIYYDSADNGPYVDLTAAQSINGNFEYDATNWAPNDRFINTSVPNNEVATAITSLVTDTVGTGQTRLVTDTIHLGSKGWRSGYKTDSENKNRKEEVWISRSITFPATNPGNLTFWVDHKGWDDVTRDKLYVEIGNNNRVLEYGSAVSAAWSQSGWTQYTIDLTPYAGATLPVNIGIEMGADNNYKTYGVFDDVEWSLTFPTIGPIESIIKAEVTKASCVINDNINIAANAKRIPGSTVRYALQLANTGLVDITAAIVTDTVPANMIPTSVRNIQVQLGVCDCLGVASASNNGPLGSADGVDPVKVDFQGINVGQLKCGYFEVDVN